MINRIMTLTTLLTCLLIFTACNDSTTSVDEGQSITEIAVSSPDFSVLVDALTQADLAGTLNTGGPFTVFAPNNGAFGALPAGVLESLTEEQLKEILLYHVIGASVLSGDLAPQQSVETLSGEEVFITTTGTGVQINGASNVFQANVIATNGVLHAVNGVLLPDAYNDVAGIAVKRYFLSTLVGAVVSTDLLEALQNPEANYTVFAPTDDAFGNLPAGTLESLTVDQLRNILLYHVVDTRILSTDLAAGTYVLDTLSGDTIEVVVAGGAITINGNATVVGADFNGTNGVVHTINNVLLP
ncbi:MAG: fasciclin domain-containing protein [Rhodothermaceae bacterium]|nr:fasciclin domain-containing protein [Rhodothermaceae bacterium]